MCFERRLTGSGMALTIALSLAMAFPVAASLPTTVETATGMRASFSTNGLGQVTIQPPGADRATTVVGNHYHIATVFGAGSGAEVPPLYCVEDGPEQFSFGRAGELFRGQPARVYSSYYLPKDRGLIFVRQRAKMLADVSFANEFQFRTQPPLFYDKFYSLPSGQELVRAEQPTFGSWIVRQDKLAEANGILFANDQVFLAYGIVENTQGDYWHARLPKSSPLHSETASDWGGLLTPLWDICHGGWNVLESKVPAGTEFLAEYYLYGGPWEGPEAIATFVQSADFEAFVAEARQHCDQVETQLLVLEDSWRRQAGEASWRDRVEDAVVEAVELQIDYQRLRGLLMDAQIRAELGGREADLGSYQAKLSAIDELYAGVPGLIDRLRATYGELGLRFSETGELAQAEILLREAEMEALALVRDCGQQVRALTGQVSRDSNLRVRLPLRGPMPQDKDLLQRPLFGVCWYYIQGTGVDGPRAALRKMKALGLNTIETGMHAMTQDRIHYALSQGGSWPEMAALLEPFRGSGLQVMIGTYSKLAAQTPEALDFLGIPREYAALPENMVFNRQGFPDYENLSGTAFTEDVYHRLAAYLRENYSDVVTAFDYNNEMSWNLNFSPHAKANFLDYMREKYGTIGALNQAWGQEFVSWEELEGSFEGTRDLEQHKLGVAAFHEWRRYAVLAYTRRFWGPVYRGLKSGWPESSAVGRDPREMVMGMADGEHPITDIPDVHSYFWHMGLPPAAMQAVADGQPWMNSEFWWAMWQQPDKIAAYYGEELAARYAKFGGGRSPEGEEATRHTCDAQFWTYFMHDCNGFLYFYWRPGNFGMEKSNGLLREAAAAQYHTMRQAEALNPLMRRTKPDTRFAVFVPHATGFVADGTHGRLPRAAFLAMSVLNVPHAGLTEPQIARGDLAKYTHLWLAAGYALPAEVAAAIENWVRRGGTLVCSGAAGVTDEIRNQRDFFAEIAGVRFGEARKLGADPESISLEGEPAVAINDPDVERKLSSMLEDYFRNVRNESKTYPLELLSEDVEVLGTYADGSPAVVESSAGQGRVLTLGPPLDYVLFRAAHAYDSRGEPYLEQLVEALEWVVQRAGVERAVRLDKWGELRISQQNVLAVLRHDPADSAHKYLFLVNLGHAFEGKIGDIHYSLVYTGEPTQVRCDLDFPVRSMREMLREVEVPLRNRPRAAWFQTTLQPGRIYAFELTLPQ